MTRLPLADFPAAVKAQATLRARLDRAVPVELLRALTEGRPCHRIRTFRQRDHRAICGRKT